MALGQTGWSLIIVLGIFLTLILYIVLMYVLASQQLWFFKKPDPTATDPFNVVENNPDAKFFFPLGKTTLLTPEEFDQRNKILAPTIAELNAKNG